LARSENDETIYYLIFCSHLLISSSYIRSKYCPLPTQSCQSCLCK